MLVRADKNLGLVAMNAEDYERMGLDMLGQSHVCVRLDMYAATPSRSRMRPETDAFELEEHELDMELLEVALFSNPCHFPGNVYLSKRGQMKVPAFHCSIDLGFETAASQ
eukprot:SAG11_NODE_12213_length_715_cov_1.267857_1_plen_110_part_00